MNDNKLQIHLKCKTKCRKMLITDMSVYMTFHPRVCGKYSMVKDTLIFSLRIWLYSLLLLRRHERETNERGREVGMRPKMPSIIALLLKS